MIAAEQLGQISHIIVGNNDGTNCWFSRKTYVDGALMPSTIQC
jgi:hypothetical protein